MMTPESGFVFKASDPRLTSQVPMKTIEPHGIIERLGAFLHPKRKRYAITAETHPELHASFARMAAKAGLPTPELVLVTSNEPNAAAVSKDQVIITTSLLRKLTFDEAEAILGHEIGHVSQLGKHMTMRIVPPLGMGVLGSAFVESATKGIAARFGKDVSKQPIWMQILSFAGFVGGAVAGNNFGVRPAELESDAIGAGLSGKPAALASGLKKIHPRQFSWRYETMRTISGYPSLQERLDNLALTHPEAPGIRVEEPQPQGAVKQPAAPAIT
jgi:heat shock protein HtpX